MSRKRNALVEALSKESSEFDGVSREELKEALSELSSSNRKPNKMDQKISGQILKVLLGLILLTAILFLIFSYGFKKILGDDPSFENLSKLNFLDLTSKKFSDSAKLLNPSNPDSAKTNKDKPAYILAKGQKFYVQVALCKFEKCIKSYTKKINSIGFVQETFALKKTTSTKKYREIISEQSFDLEKGQDLVDFINTVNDRNGYANLISVGDEQYKISLGTFPDLETAESLLRYYESLVYSEQIRFVFQDTSVSSSNGLVRVVAGPFSNKADLKEAFTKIKSDTNLSNSFVITR